MAPLQQKFVAAMALGRPFRDVGTALVLRIELTAGHFVVPLITLPPNVVLLFSGQKNIENKNKEEATSLARHKFALFRQLIVNCAYT